jgi:hypothetical protein
MRRTRRERQTRESVVAAASKSRNCCTPLIGLDPGWVTGLPLPRTAALRVLGNGVVPAQAALALRLLLRPHWWAVTG